MKGVVPIYERRGNQLRKSSLNIGLFSIALDSSCVTFSNIYGAGEGGGHDWVLTLDVPVLLLAVSKSRKVVLPQPEGPMIPIISPGLK